MDDPGPKNNVQGAAEGPNVIDLRKTESHDSKHQVVDNHHNSENNEAATDDYTLSCEIHSKDALSALARAQTRHCRQNIADVACMEQNGTLYPKKLPRYCPLKGM